ncbi:MAG: DUF1016 N-terminal domain-containing protein, partial [Desulfurivibrionaceae bacterium]
MDELKKNNPGPDYAHLFAEVKERVRSAQYAALKAVNTELVGLYWDIGRMIVNRQTDAEHGSAIAEQLASVCPGMRIFVREREARMLEKRSVLEYVSTFQLRGDEVIGQKDHLWTG